jgi:hypothetical protein
MTTNIQLVNNNTINIQDFAEFNTMNFRNLKAIDNIVFECEVQEGEDFVLTIFSNAHTPIAIPVFINGENIYKGGVSQENLKDFTTSDAWELLELSDGIDINGFHVPNTNIDIDFKFVKDTSERDYISVKVYGCVGNFESESLSTVSPSNSRGIGIELQEEKQSLSYSTEVKYNTPEFLFEIRYKF